MPKYRVMIHGRNFLKQIDGERQRLGFYTQVFVEADDAAGAESRAIDVLRQDFNLNDGVLNERDDPPSISAEEIEQVGSFDGCTLPRAGLVYYQAERK